MHELVHVVGAVAFARVAKDALDPSSAGGASEVNCLIDFAASRDDKAGEYFGNKILRCQNAAKQVGMFVHRPTLSVGFVAVPTVADAGGVTSLSGESPALCTTCDTRLTDTAIRACSVRDCPHAQQEAA